MPSPVVPSHSQESQAHGPAVFEITRVPETDTRGATG